MSRRGENIYKRKDGRWEGRYLKGRKGDGSIKYGYIYERSYQACRKKLLFLKVSYSEKCQKKGSSSLLFVEWAKQWLHTKKNTIKSSTYSHYYYKLNRYILPVIGDQALNDLDVVDLQKMIHHWEQSGLTTSSILVICQILNQCLKSAVENELIFKNPMKQVKKPRQRKNKVSAMNKQQQAKLENTAKKVQRKKGLPVLLALQAGLRIGEIAALQWKDIDFDQRTIRISQTYQRILTPNSRTKTRLILTESKTTASLRIIPMTRQLSHLLREHQKNSQDTFVFEVKGHPLEPRLLTYYFHQIRQQAGLSNIHFHQLRHTFATRCLEAQSDIASVSAMMGHSSTQMTLDIYTDAILEQRYYVIDQMEKAS